MADVIAFVIAGGACYAWFRYLNRWQGGVGG